MAKLYVLPSCWGLPTFHPECLSAYAYLKLAGVDFELVPISSTAAAQFGGFVVWRKVQALDCN